MVGTTHALSTFPTKYDNDHETFFSNQRADARSVTTPTQQSECVTSCGAIAWATPACSKGSCEVVNRSTYRNCCGWPLSFCEGGHSREGVSGDGCGGDGLGGLGGGGDGEGGCGDGGLGDGG